MSTENQQYQIPVKSNDPSRYAHLTPAQKWEQAVKLREMAWSLKKAAIKQSHPDWSNEQVLKAVREIFLYAST